MMKLINSPLVQKNKKYILITLICFFLLLFDTLLNNAIVEMSFKYLIQVSFRKMINQEFGNYFSYMYQLIKNNLGAFDYVIIYGTRLYQVYVAILSASGSLFFVDYLKTSSTIEMYRVENKRKFIINKVLFFAAKLGTSIFVSFLLFYILEFLISSTPEWYTPLERELFVDWFGEEIYLNHMYFYYLIDGFIRFFFVPFVLCLFGNCIAILTKRNFDTFVSVNFFYFGFAVLSFPLLRFSWGIYVSPATILCSGAYVDCSTIGCFLIYIMSLISSVIMLSYITRRKEIL